MIAIVPWELPNFKNRPPVGSSKVVANILKRPPDDSSMVVVDFRNRLSIGLGEKYAAIVWMAKYLLSSAVSTTIKLVVTCKSIQATNTNCFNQ